jgi:hypothetical protein
VFGMDANLPLPPFLVLLSFFLSASTSLFLSPPSFDSDLFFRQNPFKGEFTIFAGLEEVLRYVHSFRFKAADIQALKARFSEWVRLI